MQVKWSSGAMADRERHFDFIANESPWAALAMDERVAAVELKLAQFPKSGRRGRMRRTRELVVQDTPFIIVYEVRDDVIAILRVIHGAQRWPPRRGR